MATCPRCMHEFDARSPADPTVPADVGWGQDCLVRPDQAHPSEWTILDDGRWRSPKGRIWKSPPKGLAAKRGEVRRPRFSTAPIPVSGWFA